MGRREGARKTGKEKELDKVLVRGRKFWQSLMCMYEEEKKEKTEGSNAGMRGHKQRKREC